MSSVTMATTAPTLERYEFWLNHIQMFVSTAREATGVIKRLYDKLSTSLGTGKVTVDLDVRSCIEELGKSLKSIVDKAESISKLITEVRNKSNEVAKLIVDNLLLYGEYRGRKLSEEEYRKLISERSRELYYAITGKWAEPYFEELYTRLTQVRQRLMQIADIVVAVGVQDVYDRVTEVYRVIGNICLLLMKASLWLVDRHVHTLYPIRYVKNLALKIRTFADAATKYLESNTESEVSYIDHIVDESYRLLLDMSIGLVMMSDVVENLPLRDDEKNHLASMITEAFIEIRDLRRSIIRTPLLLRKYTQVFNVFEFVKADTYPIEELLDILQKNLEKALQDLEEEKKKALEKKPQVKA